MKERFGAKDPKSQMLRFHTQTAGCTLTAQQPDNNIMRVTIQALAAVLGGTQSLHTNSRDEALALPTEDSVRIALRTQQVIAYESGVADSIDPLAGSFLVESLTDQIEKAALEYIDKIDSLGGAVEAISRGFQQKEIQDSAYAYQKAIEKDELIIVGVNKFTVKEPPPTGLLKVKEEVEISQKRLPGRHEGGARQRSRHGCPGNSGNSRQRDGQPHAAHPGGGQGLCHPGRDRRCLPRGLRQAYGDGRTLISFNNVSNPKPCCNNFPV